MEDLKKQAPEFAPFYERINSFVAAINMGDKITDDLVAQSLQSLIGDPGQEALEILSQKDAVSDVELRDALKGLSIPIGKLNLHISKLRGEVPVSEDSSSSVTTAVKFLPSVPDDDSFIAALKTDGVLKVKDTDVLAAVKAAIASKARLYSVPDKLLELIEKFASDQQEPFDEKYYEIRNMITEKNYADVLSVINVKSQFITETKRKEFLEKLESILWAELASFNEALSAWQKVWTDGMPAMMMNVIAMGNAAPGANPAAGMMTPPDTGSLHSAAEEVINKINRIFAGPGIPVSRALTQDALRIKKVLNDDGVLKATGSPTKDILLKSLGITVGADLIRAEQSISQYTLAVMHLPAQIGDDEIIYLTQLVRLGASIPWTKLTTGVRATL